MKRNRSQHTGIWNKRAQRFLFVLIILQASVTTISLHLRIRPRRRENAEKVENTACISGNFEAVFLKLGTQTVHHKRNEMTPLVLLP